MSARKLNGLFVFILCSSGLTSAPLYASGLLGSSLGWQYYGGGGEYNPGNGSVTSGTFADNGGIGGTFVEQGDTPIFNILADDSSVTFDFSADQIAETLNFVDSPQSLAPTIFNGIAVNLLSGGDIANVAIDPETNMAGFGASDFSFTTDQIEVNLATLPYSDSTILKLDVTLEGTSTPEPATGALTLISILTAVFVRRRNRVS